MKVKKKKKKEKENLEEHYNPAIEFKKFFQ